MTNAVGVEPGVRYVVSSLESWLTFEAHSSLHAVSGKTTLLDGYVVPAWNPDGSLVTDPLPAIHVEFPVEQLRSGNAMMDREMWKLVDSKRFPRVTADLRELVSASPPGRYRAGGDVTLSGRTKRYQGEITLARDAESITIDGELLVDIRDFGLKPPSLLLFVKVDPVVKVRLHLVAKKVA